MEDETKNGTEFLVTVPFDTKKRLSCTIKQFPTLVRQSFESLSLLPEQILQYGAFNPIKDSISKTLASELGKSFRTGRRSICRMFSVKVMVLVTLLML